MAKTKPELPENRPGEYDYPLKNRIAALKIMNDAEDKHREEHLKAASEAREKVSDGE